MARRPLLGVLAACAVLGCAAVVARFGSPAIWPLPQRTAVWHRRHEAKVIEARQRAGQVDLLFVGDSITQNYERTEPEPYLNFRPIWNEFFAPHRAINLGFDADRTYNALWRLRHGEIDGLAPHDIVLLIGTNDLSSGLLHPAGESVAQASDGVLAVAEYLHQRIPAARVLVLAILPTGFGTGRTAKGSAINERVRTRVASLPYARFLDLTSLFRDGQDVRMELYYDAQVTPGAAALHPNAQGQRLMAEAIVAALYTAR